MAFRPAVATAQPRRPPSAVCGAWRLAGRRGRHLRQHELRRELWRGLSRCWRGLEDPALPRRRGGALFRHGAAARAARSHRRSGRVVVGVRRGQRCQRIRLPRGRRAGRPRHRGHGRAPQGLAACPSPRAVRERAGALASQPRIRCAAARAGRADLARVRDADDFLGVPQRASAAGHDQRRRSPRACTRRPGDAARVSVLHDARYASSISLPTVPLASVAR